MKKSGLKINLGLIAFFVIAYVVSPSNLNPVYASGAFSWLFVISAFILVNLFRLMPQMSFVTDESGRVSVNLDTKAKGFKQTVTVVGVLWVAYFAVSIASTPLFNSSAYRDQIGTPVVADFNEDVQVLDLSQVPIVDKALAKSLADKKLGENPGMGSQVYLGEPVMQQVAGELMWVVPLQHSGFFKWFNNMEGSAGYIKVSATNLQDIEFVSMPIKYQPNSYFFDDIERYLRVSQGYSFEAMTDYSFEITDEGEPYWIITTYENEWLFSLPEATGVITLNARTGETEKYTLENVPTWVDRVQPEDFIINQIDNQGLYVHGVLNFSNKDKYQSSEEAVIVYNEGKCYLFTGLTSVGTDESAIGFMMVDMVTKESKLYQISGATEWAGMLSAEGTVQQFGYRATSPIIINHNGVPTYFITLKDQSGLIKQYAFVSISSVGTVGVGDTINSALRDYETALGNINSFVTQGSEAEELTATVVRIASEDLGNGLVYRMILKQNEETIDKIFVASAETSAELSLTKEGDTVSIEFFETTSGVITVQSFDNEEFTQ